MGNLTLECVASDGASLYGFAIGRYYTDTVEPGDVPLEYNILLKSNPNPPSFNDIAWTVLATIQRTALYSVSFVAYNSVQCAVDPKGVFTLLAYKGRTTPTAPIHTPFLGFRFDPAGDGNLVNGAAHRTGTGSWVNLTGAADYPWNMTNDGMSRLFAVPGETVGGPSDWIQVMTDTVKGAVLSFGRLRSNSTVFERAAVWEMPRDIYGDAKHVSYFKDHLYVMGTKNDTALSRSIVAVPLANTTIPLQAPTTGLKVFNASTARESYLQAQSVSGGFGDTLYIVTERIVELQGGPIMFTLNTTEENASLSAPIKVNTVLKNPITFIPMGAINSTNPFAFAADHNVSYSLALAGATMGTWSKSLYSATVPGNLGVSSDVQVIPNPTLSSSSKRGGRSSGEPMQPWLIAIIALSVLLISGFVAWRVNKERDVAVANGTWGLSEEDAAAVLAARSAEEQAAQRLAVARNASGDGEDGDRDEDNEATELVPRGRQQSHHSAEGEGGAEMRFRDKEDDKAPQDFRSRIAGFFRRS